MDVPVVLVVPQTHRNAASLHIQLHFLPAIATHGHTAPLAYTTREGRYFEILRVFCRMLTAYILGASKERDHVKVHWHLQSPLGNMPSFLGFCALAELPNDRLRLT